MKGREREGREGRGKGRGGEGKGRIRPPQWKFLATPLNALLNDFVGFLLPAKLEYHWLTLSASKYVGFLI
jgi:hypothetical protein